MADVVAKTWPSLRPAISDATNAARLAISSSWRDIVRDWIIIPAGLLVILVFCFAVDVLLRHFSASFPSSVACLVLLFLALLLLEAVLGGHKTRKIVTFIDVPAGWSLRWINVFFTPSFVLLPLSPPIGIAEVFKMIAIFVIGFIVMMALAAYMTRGLQLLIPSSKRAVTARAEELGEETDEIPMVESTPIATEPPSTTISAAPSSVNLNEVAAPSRSQLPPYRPQDDAEGNTTPLRNGSVADIQPVYAQAQPPPARSQRWADIMSSRLDTTTYAALFTLVGLPIYFATGYTMPVHLTLSVLAYLAAMKIPPSWRQYLHPVLVSSLLTVLGIWALAALHGDSLPTALRAYRTGTKYLQLWEGTTTGSGHPPGAGDVFGTLLDASIVSLALPMFQFRRELREHFVAIVVPNVVIAVASLFAYPPLCFAVGIGAARSLAFAARSLTLALAIPATKNLGGDDNTVAALAIMSGIMGVLAGQRMLAWMRIPDDDYVTRGVTLGANSSAIGTALLLRTDPRAAALSSLSMSLFGTITVLFTSIPPMANIVRSLVGL